MCSQRRIRIQSVIFPNEPRTKRLALCCCEQHCPDREARGHARKCDDRDGEQYVYRRRSRQAWVLLDFCDRDSSYRELLLVKASSMRALCSDTEKCSEKRINHDNCLIRLHTTTPLTYTFAFCNPSVETCPIIVNIQSASVHPSWGFQIL